MPVGPLARLSDWYRGAPYVAGRTPGGAPRPTLRDGANCQLWAYCVLDHLGFSVPDLRSDALWSDHQAIGWGRHQVETGVALSRASTAGSR